MAYTIVSFCGGGVRGLISSTILKNLASHNPRILRGTSLLAGTSIGADIVSSLTVGKSPAEIGDGIVLAAETVFKFPHSNPTSPAYDINLSLDLQRVMHSDKPLSSLQQQVVLTGFNVGAAPAGGNPATPWFAQLFTNVNSPLVDTAATQIAEAVVASGAMPGMLGSLGGYVDGAFVHHDPTLAAIALAVSSGVELGDIVAICIGTGFMANWIGCDTSKWGAQQWLMGDGSAMNSTPPLLVNQANLSPILNISLNGTSTNLMPWLCQMLLGKRYVYLNPTLESYIPENAWAPEQLQYLVSSAQELTATPAWQQATTLLDTYWTE
jgi:predicted acylesterase/phospholipase RssA